MKVKGIHPATGGKTLCTSIQLVEEKDAIHIHTADV